MAFTQAQLERRKSYLGGTDLAAIAGVSPWRGPLQTYLAKTQGESVVQTSDPRKKWMMDVGNFLEGAVASMYASRMNLPTEELVEIGEPVFDPDKPYFGANPDRLYFDRTRGLEIKTTGEGELHNGSDKWGEDGTDEIPLHYLVQCQWYMGITGIHAWDLAAFFLGNSRELRIYKLHFDQDIYDGLREKGDLFWHQHVLPRVPPEDDPDLSVMASYLAGKAAKNTERVEPSPAAMEAAALLRRISAEKKALEAEEASAKVLLLQELTSKGGSSMKGNGWSSSIVAPEAKPVVDWERLALANIHELEIQKLIPTYTTHAARAPYLMTRFGKEK